MSWKDWDVRFRLLFGLGYLMSGYPRRSAAWWPDMVVRFQEGGLLGKLLRWWREPTLMEQLIQAELDGPPVREEDIVLDARIAALGPGQRQMSEAEIREARRFRAVVTYGTLDEEPEEIALLTREERECLEPIAIQSRWASFRRNQD